MSRSQRSGQVRGGHGRSFHASVSPRANSFQFNIFCSLDSTESGSIDLWNLFACCIYNIQQLDVVGVTRKSFLLLLESSIRPVAGVTRFSCCLSHPFLLLLESSVPPVVGVTSVSSAMSYICFPSYESHLCFLCYESHLWFSCFESYSYFLCLRVARVFPAMRVTCIIVFLLQQRLPFSLPQLLPLFPSCRSYMCFLPAEAICVPSCRSYLCSLL